MNSMRAYLATFAVLALGTVIWSQTKPMKAPDAAEAFLLSLSSEQESRAAKGFDSDYRKNWRFVPATREGVNLGELSEKQQILATALLKSSLSESGYKKIEGIKGLEDVLFALENGNKIRDRRLYTFTFFGHPSPKGAWGWRYEGHHVSLNFTYSEGKLISSSPQFFGANPAEVQSGTRKGFRALPEEQDLGFALVGLLTPDQLEKAVVGKVAPAEIVTSNARKAAVQSQSGLKYTEMNDAQKNALSKLIAVHVNPQNAAEAKRRQGRVDLKTVVFAWMGETKPGQGHYYRIQGSKFLIEYDNTQNKANHVHVVWRDFDGDFGEDQLTRHYANHPH